MGLRKQCSGFVLMKKKSSSCYQQYLSFAICDNFREIGAYEIFNFVYFIAKNDIDLIRKTKISANCALYNVC